MKAKHTMRSRVIACLLALTMAVALVFSLTVSANAAVNEKVTDAKNGVVQIQVWFVDPEAALQYYLHSGTGFLINEDTVITCQHVATGFPDEFYVEWAQATNAEFGGNRTAAQVKENLELRISVLRDVYVKATVKTASTEMDYAVLKLNEKIHNRTPLKIRSSATLQQTEAVYALGFPADISSLGTTHHYDAADVTITTGNVNKVGEMSFATTDGGSYDHVNCVESSALITGGNSGGPLVDANGNVVGINAAGNETRNIAVSSDQLIAVLNALGIKYTEAGASTTPTTPADTTPAATTPSNVAPSIDTDGLEKQIEKAEAKLEEKENYTEASVKALEEALEEAEDALKADDQDEIDEAEAALKDAIKALEKAEAKGGNSGIIMIAIIAVVAIVIILIVVILIVVLTKKKPAPAPAPAPAPRPAAPAAAPRPAAPAPRPAAPAPAPAPRPAAPASSETTVLNQGGGETTVLSQGGGETTVLSQAVNGGTLVRVSNNERIAISTADFSVGRERTSVDYCVGGNTNISRIHARFVVRNGVTYIVDNKAANGTFVNGVKVQAGKEVELKSGDKIVLADEKFEFTK